MSFSKKSKPGQKQYYPKNEITTPPIKKYIEKVIEQ